MPGLINLLWLLPAALLVHYFWRSGKFKGRARDLAAAHCLSLNLQLLDQSMVIVGFWPAINPDGRAVMRRRYQFEFTSTGQSRYRGLIVLLGLQFDSIELEAYVLPGGH